MGGRSPASERLVPAMENGAMQEFDRASVVEMEVKSEEDDQEEEVAIRIEEDDKGSGLDDVANSLPRYTLGYIHPSRVNRFSNDHWWHT